LQLMVAKAAAKMINKLFFMILFFYFNVFTGTTGCFVSKL